MTFKHLEERSAYEERYDSATIERCRSIEDHFLSPEVQQKGLSDGRGFPDWIMPLQIFHLTGEQYRDREETINERMEKDRQRDAMLAQARPPFMRCPSCGQQMECVDTSIKYGFEKGERDRVAFFLTCKPCKEVYHIYENGTPVTRKPLLCSKCNREVEFSSEERDGKYYYIRTCKHCGHVEERMNTLDEEESPTAEEIERFERDKKRFCISEEQGKRFLEWEKRMKQIDDQKEEHLLNVELYDRVKEVKSLNIASLEKKLRKALEKAGYADLHTTMPPSGREIVLEFTVRDTKDTRKDLESRKALQETIESALEMTNWSLYPESVTYRLGLLNGRIRGYESQEELETLTRSRMKKHTKKRQ